MASRRSRNSDPLDLIGPALGILFALSLISPQARALLMALPALLIAGGGVFLVGFVALLLIRHHQKSRNQGLPPLIRTSGTDIPVHTQARITAELLAELEWRRFEILVTVYFQRRGFKAWRKRAGADGGVDILLAHPDEQAPCACVQCKAWKTYDVGVKLVRELLGVMTADNLPMGYVVTTGKFTKEALVFAQGKPLVLVDGKLLLEDLNSFPEADRKAILTEVTAGDYTTPTCPSCDIKMVERKGPKGLFWGCSNYPRCRQSFNIRDDNGKPLASRAAG